MKKTNVKMNNPIYLGLSILGISKMPMYEFWYDYIEPKYDDNAKLCFMDTDSFIFHVKTEDFYEDIANDVEKRFDTSNYKVNRKYLSKDSKEAKANIEKLYNARKVAIDFFDEYTSRASEARRQAKKGTGLKILTPKQMLQRLTVALAQIKAEIIQRVY